LSRLTEHEPELDTYHSLDDLAEDHVLAIEPAGLVEEDEELGAVCVLAVVGHGHHSGGAVAQDEVLVDELVAVDAATCGGRGEGLVNVGMCACVSACTRGIGSLYFMILES